MNISRFYQDSAALSLNGSIVSLGPAGFIIVGNLLFINRAEVMLTTMPFFIYSFICFHIYLYRMRQSQSIKRNISDDLSTNSQTMFTVPHVMVLFQQTLSSELKFFFSNGLLAGTIKRDRKSKCNFISLGKAYALFGEDGVEMGYFRVRGNRIAVYDQKENYIGCFEKRQNNKQLHDAKGRVSCYVDGATMYMDEKVLTKNRKQAARLRRGWMSIILQELFPDPNTPVLSFSELLSEEDKLLTMSILINEYFIER